MQHLFSNFYLKTTAFATVLKFSWIQENVANETVENRSKEKKRVGEFVCLWVATDTQKSEKVETELQMVALVWSLGLETKQNRCRQLIAKPLFSLQLSFYRTTTTARTTEQPGVMAVTLLPAFATLSF